MVKEGLQNILRKDGTLPIISVEADNLAEATYKSIVACHKYGARVETPKHRKGTSLGYDANMIVQVKNPDDDPKIYFPGVHDNARGVKQYILEVTHGIHNHWKKSEEHPDRWGYTYNERFVDQLPFVFQRIKADWDEKMHQWGEGKGRPSGRDYQFAIWRAGEDIIMEQDDPPCWQLGQIRMLMDEQDNLTMNYQTNWRSRDLLKAWNENNIAQIELMKLFGNKISNMLDVPIKLGSYTDHSDSLHLYGSYVDENDLDNGIPKLEQEGLHGGNSMGLEDYFSMDGGDNALKGLINAQTLAEKDGHGLNLPEDRLKEKGYNTKDYPSEWDAWDSMWDVEPDISKLARVK